MSDDGAIGNVREAFQGRRGKILIVGGGLAVAAYVIYTRRNGTPEAVPPDEVVPVEGEGRVPQTDPEVGNTDSDAGGKPGRPTNNAAWISDGVDFLIGRGTPAAAAYDAITKALGGLPMSSQQVAWVSQVISALGSPPEGMPPLNSSAPITPPQQPVRRPLTKPGVPPPGHAATLPRRAGAAAARPAQLAAKK